MQVSERGQDVEVRLSDLSAKAADAYQLAGELTCELPEANPRAERLLDTLLLLTEELSRLSRGRE